MTRDEAFRLKSKQVILDRSGDATRPTKLIVEKNRSTSVHFIHICMNIVYDDHICIVNDNLEKYETQKRDGLGITVDQL